MQRTRRQHVVSAFYLKGFANESGRLVCTPLSGANPYPISVSDATVQNDFYSIALPSGEVSDYFERAFSEVEGPAAAAVRMLVESAQSPGAAGDERAALATWIALQYLRSQAVRRQGAEMHALMVNLVVGTSGKQRLREHIEREEGAPISDARLDAEWKDLTSPDGPEIRANPADHLRTITGLLPGTAALVRDSPWMLVRFTRKVLTTGDHPVALLRDPNTPQWSGVGLSTAWGYSLPLARHLGLIIMTSEVGTGLPDAPLAGTAYQAKTLNSSTISNSRKLLFHHPDDDPRSWFGGLPKPQDREMARATHEYSEDGWFAQDTSAPSPQPIHDRVDELHEDDEGFSLDDLAWPIPGRVFRWREPE